VIGDGRGESFEEMGEAKGEMSKKLNVRRWKVADET
jgi:hypothetical protein